MRLTINSPFGDLEVNLYYHSDHKDTYFGCAIFGNHASKINNVEYNLRMDCKLRDNQWKDDHLSLSRTDHNYNAPFPRNARDKFTKYILPTLAQTFNESHFLTAQQEYHQQTITNLQEEITTLTDQIATAHVKLKEQKTTLEHVNFRLTLYATFR